MACHRTDSSASTCTKRAIAPTAAWAPAAISIRRENRTDATIRPTDHAGDLPNLSSDGEGVAVFSFTTDQLTVAPGPHSVVNRAIVIHESADDYKSQPAGNSGKRIACGIIRSAD